MNTKENAIMAMEAMANYYCRLLAVGPPKICSNLNVRI
jgi:hypothetical protein